MIEADDAVWPRLYPEFGSLAGFFDALMRACADEGTDVNLTDASSGPIRAAKLRFTGGGPRTVSVSINRNQHGFVLSFSDAGVEAVRGQVEDIRDVARAVRGWLRDQRSAIEMNTTPRLAVTKTEARRVFGDTVELQWWLPLQPFSWASEAHRSVLEAAQHVAELRQLAPILSMNDLLFSECTESPWSVRVPWLRIISAKEERPAQYEVRTGPRDFDHDRSTLLGAGGLDAALALVKEHLPADLRPAIVGDWHDLHPEVPRPPRYGTERNT